MSCAYVWQHPNNYNPKSTMFCSQLLVFGALCASVSAAPALPPVRKAEAQPPTSPNPRGTAQNLLYNCESGNTRYTCMTQFNSYCNESYLPHLRTDYNALCGQGPCWCEFVGNCGHYCKTGGEGNSTGVGSDRVEEGQSGTPDRG